jgi:hypothetical protein
MKVFNTPALREMMAAGLAACRASPQPVELSFWEFLPLDMLLWHESQSPEGHFPSHNKGLVRRRFRQSPTLQ